MPMQCPICLEDITEEAFLRPCLHCFCLPCILQWFESAAAPQPQEVSCPLCKGPAHSLIHNISHPLQSLSQISLPLQPPSSKPRHSTERSRVDTSSHRLKGSSSSRRLSAEDRRRCYDESLAEPSRSTPEPSQLPTLRNTSLGDSQGQSHSGSHACVEASIHSHDQDARPLQLAGAASDAATENQSSQSMTGADVADQWSQSVSGRATGEGVAPLGAKGGAVDRFWRWRDEGVAWKELEVWVGEELQAVMEVDDVDLLVSHIIGTVKHLELEARRRVQFSHALALDARSRGPGCGVGGPGSFEPWDWWLEEIAGAVSPFLFDKSRRFALRLGAEAHRLGFGPAWASMKRGSSFLA